VLVLIALVVLIAAPEPWGLVAVAAALVLEVVELAFWKRFLRRYRLRSGPETLIGSHVMVVEPCDPNGRVRVRGELWRARSEVALKRGETARIASIEGLTLHVEPDR